MNLSASLDFLLCLVCLAIAIASARVGNDFLFSGLMWVTAAAFAGTFNLGGLTWTNETHEFLSQVARGPGMLAMGVGVLAAVYGPPPGARWLAPALSIVGAGAVHLWNASPRFDAVSTLLGSLLLVALLVLAIVALREGRTRSATAGFAALALLLLAAFGVGRIPLAADGTLRHVDVLHLVLIACYSLVWLAVRDMSRTVSLG